MCVWEFFVWEDKYMKKKSIKSNIIWMAILAVTIIISLVLISRVGGIWKRLCGYLFLLSILGIIIDVSVIFMRKMFNKKIKNLPYDFDYEAELFVYKNIGRDKKEKVVKSLKSNFQIPNVYTEWREQLTKRNEKIKDNENFYHFIKRCLRKAEKNSEFLSAITVPVEIALLTVLPTFDGSLIEKMITLLVCTGVLAFVISWKFYKYKHEIEFATDVIDILCPEFVSEGNRILRK